MHSRTDPSFNDYILSRRFIVARSNADNWRFVAYASGDEAIRSARDWTALKTLLGARSVPEELRAAARSVWRSYERWRSTVSGTAARYAPKIAAAHGGATAARDREEQRKNDAAPHRQSARAPGEPVLRAMR